MDAVHKKIGIFGGTFNPIHYGHLLIAENACDQFQLDHVIFLPTGHAPHKAFSGEEMSVHRCRMVEAAIADNRNFSISYREIRNSGVNYTYATLEALQREHPQCEFYFILGADSLFYFDEWMHPERICESAKILAAVRDTLDEERLDTQIRYLREKFQCECFRLNTPNFSVSSRELRERVANGKTIRYMVPDSVADYIRENRLYQEEPA